VSSDLAEVLILHEFQMAIFAYCWRLRSHCQARW